MADDFENHCWKDIVPPDVLDIYTHYVRKTFVGPAPALLAIDLYELAYQGGPKPVAQLHKTYASTCGENAYAAIEPTKRLFAAARAAGIPIFYTTQDTQARQHSVARHRDQAPARAAGSVALCHQVRVQAAAGRRRHHQAARLAASTARRLMAHLTQLGIQTVIVCGESTSGCVRASSVDAYSNGFHVVVVEECCFDRSMLSHKVNLFDMHHKYTDVMHVDEVVAHLNGLAVKKAS